MLERIFVAMLTSSIGLAVPQSGTSSTKIGSKVIELEDIAAVNKALAKSGPIVILYHADWCGYCQDFSPKFDATSPDYDRCTLLSHERR